MCGASRVSHLNRPALSAVASSVSHSQCGCCCDPGFGKDEGRESHRGSPCFGSRSECGKRAGSMPKLRIRSGWERRRNGSRNAGEPSAVGGEPKWSSWSESNAAVSGSSGAASRSARSPGVALPDTVPGNPGPGTRSPRLSWHFPPSIQVQCVQAAAVAQRRQHSTASGVWESSTLPTWLKPWKLTSGSKKAS